MFILLILLLGILAGIACTGGESRPPTAASIPTSTPTIETPTETPATAMIISSSTETPTSTPTRAPISTRVPTPTPVSTPATPAPTPTPALTPMPNPTPTVTPSPTPTPPAVPTPTHTPTPAPTPAPAYLEAWNYLPNSSWLDRSNPPLAADIKALSWMADGIDDTEAKALRELLYLATKSASAVSNILAFGWVLDGIDEVEAQTIDWLVLADAPSSSLLAAIDNWSKESISSLDAEAIGYLSSISHYYDHNDVLLSMDWIQDGLSELEGGVLKDLWALWDKAGADTDTVIEIIDRWYTPPPPPVVQIVYAMPSDKEIKQEYVTAVGEAALHVQGWYADRLEGRTFELSASIPDICHLPGPAEYYERQHGWNRILADLQPCAPVANGSPFYAWAVYADVPYDCEQSELGRGGAGVTIMHGLDLEGVVNGATQCGFVGNKWRYIGGLAHEIGHVFGLSHPPGCDKGLDTCDKEAMMGRGYSIYPNTYFTEADIEVLLESPFIHRVQEAAPSETDS